MKNDVISINKPMLIKAFIISFILLTVAFTAGIILGKSDKALLDRTSADSSDVQEQLSDCSYKLQEITTRHLDLADIAKKRGLVDSEGRYYPDVICSAMKEESDDDDETSDESETPDETVDNPEKKTETEKKPAIENKTEPEKKNVPEKKIEPEKVTEAPVKDCLYSIQVFAGTSKEQAVAAQKKYKISGTRLVEGIVKQKSWYRIRYGCFSTKDEAEKFLPGIKDKIEGAIVVAE